VLIISTTPFILIVKWIDLLTNKAIPPLPKPHDAPRYKQLLHDQKIEKGFKALSHPVMH
tara:strand:+ start:596 stop:772 length:177 start_codon:yes stop_codon:yes gene_type:complete